MSLAGNIVIYGGSFNPPHIGHQIACLWITQALEAEVIVVPTFQHPDKQLEDFGHRIEMCKLLAKPLKRVSVSEVEKQLPTPSRTINVLNRYRCGNLVLAIGSDLVHQVESWYNWNLIKRVAKILVIGRSNFDYSQIGYECYHYPIELSAISSSQIRELIKTGEDITGLVPARVKKYIDKHKLYRM